MWLFLLKAKKRRILEIMSIVFCKSRISYSNIENVDRLIKSCSCSAYLRQYLFISVTDLEAISPFTMWIGTKLACLLICLIDSAVVNRNATPKIYLIDHLCNLFIRVPFISSRSQNVGITMQKRYRKGKLRKIVIIILQNEAENRGSSNF